MSQQAAEADRQALYEPTLLDEELNSSSQSHLKLVLLIGALSTFGPLSIDMYLPSLPSLTRDLGGAAWLVQLTLTGCLLGLAAGQVVAGPLSDTLGRRRPLLIGVAAYAAASFLCALAPNVYFLIALRLVQGMAGAAGIVIARAIVRDLFTGHELARFFAFTMLVNGMAPMIAPVLGGQILRFTSWRGVFLVLTVIGCALWLAALLGLSETLSRQRRRPSGITITLRTFQSLGTDPVFMGYALANGLAFGGMFAYISGSPFVLENIYGISAQAFGLFFAFNALGIVLMGQLSGRLVRRFGPRRLLITGLAGTSCGGAVLLSVVLAGAGLPGVVAGLFLLVASLGFIGPNATALAMADHPHQAGSASALLGVLQFVIGGFAAPLVGIAGAHSALPMAIVIAVQDAAAVLAFFVLSGRGARTTTG